MRYFRRTADIGRGPGVAYFEFDDEWATRQIEIYGERWYCSSQGYHQDIGPAVLDQPLSSLEFEQDDEVSAEEFARVWSEAGARCNLSGE